MTFARTLGPRTVGIEKRNRMRQEIELQAARTAYEVISEAYRRGEINFDESLKATRPEGLSLESMVEFYETDKLNELFGGLGIATFNTGNQLDFGPVKQNFVRIMRSSRTLYYVVHIEQFKRKKYISRKKSQQNITASSQEVTLSPPVEVKHPEPNYTVESPPPAATEEYLTETSYKDLERRLRESGKVK